MTREKPKHPNDIHVVSIKHGPMEMGKLITEATIKIPYRGYEISIPTQTRFPEMLAVFRPNENAPAFQDYPEIEGIVNAKAFIDKEIGHG